MAKRINSKSIAQIINGLSKEISYSSIELKDRFKLSTNYLYPILNEFFTPEGKGKYRVKSTPQPIYFKNVDRVLDEVRKTINKVPTPSELKSKIDDAITLLHKEGYIILKVC